MTDLGTYHVRVVTSHGSFIYQWRTGRRFCKGMDGISPVDSAPIPPGWTNARELCESIIYMFTEGSFSCDCSLGSFIARSKQESDPDLPCGDTITLVGLDVLRANVDEWEPLWVRP